MAADRSPVVELSWHHTARMCDSLDLHAYAVRRSLVTALMDQVRSTEGIEYYVRAAPFRPTTPIRNHTPVHRPP